MMAQGAAFAPLRAHRPTFTLVVLPWCDAQVPAVCQVTYENGTLLGESANDDILVEGAQPASDPAHEPGVRQCGDG
jgi:hypothetical protein